MIREHLSHVDWWGGLPWILAFAILSLVAMNWEFVSFAIAAVAQLIFGGGVDGFPSPSVFQ